MFISHHALLSSLRLMDDLSSFSEVDGLHHSFNPFLIEAFLDHFEDVKLRLFWPSLRATSFKRRLFSQETCTLIATPVPAEHRIRRADQIPLEGLLTISRKSENLKSWPELSYQQHFNRIVNHESNDKRETGNGQCSPGGYGGDSGQSLNGNKEYQR